MGNSSDIAFKKQSLELMVSCSAAHENYITTILKNCAIPDVFLQITPFLIKVESL